jgi:glutamate--cysteine ligase
LLYLFGASPAVCRSFIQNLDHRLDQFNEGTYYLPYATSLRMGRLGYQSDAQSKMHVSYNSLGAYSKSMREGLTKTHPEYAQFQPTAGGEYQQLNDSILQIENEFYGTIRPKRTARSGERPLKALNSWGVEYIEVRCIDLSPFEPVGINLEQMRFMDTFLLLCLVADSPQDSREETARMDRNQTAVVERGREPEVTLEKDTGKVRLVDWANELLALCGDISMLLDVAHNSQSYSESLQKQLRKVASAQQTPSAKILAALSMRGSFSKFSLDHAQKHHAHFLDQGLSTEDHLALVTEAKESIERQAAIEASETIPFRTFLKDYIKVF